MAISDVTLQIHYENHSALQIMDSKDHKPMYQVTLSRSKPQVSVYRLPNTESGATTTANANENGRSQQTELAPQGTELPPRSTATFSLTSTKVHLRVRGRDILLHKDRLLTRSHKFVGADGFTYYWEADTLLKGDFSFVRMVTSATDYAAESDAAAGTTTGVALQNLDNESRSRKVNPAANGVNGESVTRDTDKAAHTKVLMARFRNKLFSVHDVGMLEVLKPFDDTLMDEMVVSLLGVLVMVQSLQLSSRVVYG